MNVFDAIYNNDYQAVKEYLEAGNVNIINEKGSSLIHLAILMEDSKIFDLLLENYININIKDNEGNTPAHLCVSTNKIGFLKTLIRKNCDLTIKNNNGETPLYVSCRLGITDIVYLICETYKFNILENNNKNESIFFALVKSRNKDLLKMVNIDSKIVNEKNIFGDTPLHYAARSGDKELVVYLISKGAFINVKNNMGETPIFNAILSENYETIELLIKNGAILDIRNSFGELLTDTILKKDILTFVEEKKFKYKLDNYKKNYPLQYYIAIGDINNVKRYLNKRYILKTDNFGYTPIDYIEYSKDDCIKKLIIKFKKSLAR